MTRADVTETTALGAAYLAGLGVGVWSTAAEVAATYRASTRVDAVRRPRRDDAVVCPVESGGRTVAGLGVSRAAPTGSWRPAGGQISDATRSRMSCSRPRSCRWSRDTTSAILPPRIGAIASSSGPAVAPLGERAEHEGAEPPLGREPVAVGRHDTVLTRIDECGPGGVEQPAGTGHERLERIRFGEGVADRVGDVERGDRRVLGRAVERADVLDVDAVDLPHLGDQQVDDGLVGQVDRPARRPPDRRPAR